jgi:putative transposase
LPRRAENHGRRVHLLVNWPPKVSIARLVNSLKGASARRVRLQRPVIARRYWKGGLWSPSYFAALCGGGPMTVLKQHIER